jgi:hypothetical protein
MLHTTRRHYLTQEGRKLQWTNWSKKASIGSTPSSEEPPQELVMYAFCMARYVGETAYETQVCLK